MDLLNSEDKLVLFDTCKAYRITRKKKERKSRNKSKQIWLNSHLHLEESHQSMPPSWAYSKRPSDAHGFCGFIFRLRVNNYIKTSLNPWPFVNACDLSSDLTQSFEFNHCAHPNICCDIYIYKWLYQTADSTFHSWLWQWLQGNALWLRRKSQSDLWPWCCCCRLII